MMVGGLLLLGGRAVWAPVRPSCSKSGTPPVVDCSGSGISRPRSQRKPSFADGKVHSITRRDTHVVALGSPGSNLSERPLPTPPAPAAGLREARRRDRSLLLRLEEPVPRRR